ncbi:MAG: hypothetical protein FJ279_01995 [Planctomycetes bacterium]|nr:hypothetical protein [Planctomycetota bacterium]
MRYTYKLCIGLMLAPVVAATQAEAPTAIARLKDRKTVITGELVKHTADYVTVKSQTGSRSSNGTT